MKVLLRDAAEREQRLLHEKDELQQKVNQSVVTVQEEGGTYFEFLSFYIKNPDTLVCHHIMGQKLPVICYCTA